MRKLRLATEANENTIKKNQILPLTYEKIHRRGGGSFVNNSIFLDRNYGNWEIIEDELGTLCLICLKKEK
jgi:hypothetical protein